MMPSGAQWSDKWFISFVGFDPESSQGVIGLLSNSMIVVDDIGALAQHGI